jgi:hypothetical protein
MRSLEHLRHRGLKVLPTAIALAVASGLGEVASGKAVPSPAHDGLQ